DLVGDAIKGNRAAYHQWIGGIAASPQLVADQDDVIPSCNLFVSEKHAPQLRLYPEQRKELRGYPCGRKTLRLAVIRHVDVETADERDPIERPRRPSPFLKMETIHWYGADARRPLVNHHESARVGIRQRAKNDGIDDAEDRRRRPDPHRQCQDGGTCKSGISSQLSQPVAHVLTEIAEPADGVHIARLLLGHRQVAQTPVSLES